MDSILSIQQNTANFWEKISCNSSKISIDFYIETNLVIVVIKENDNSEEIPILETVCDVLNSKYKYFIYAK